MFYLTIVNKTRRHCHSWLAGQYLCSWMFYKLLKALSFSLSSGPRLKCWVDSLRTQYGKLTKRASGSGGRLSDRDKWILDKFSFLSRHIYRIPSRSGVDVSFNNNRKLICYQNTYIFFEQYFWLVLCHFWVYVVTFNCHPQVDGNYNWLCL